MLNHNLHLLSNTQFGIVLSMIDLKNFITPYYLFNPNPSSNFKFLLPLLIFFALMLVVAIIFPIWFRKRKKKSPPRINMVGKIQTPLLTFSLIGVLLLFFRWQALPYLSTRILLLTLLISFLVWLFLFLIYLKVGFQKEIKNWHMEREKLKYFPKGAKK